MQPLSMRVPEAVRLSGIPRSSLYEAMRRGELVARKAGRRTLICLTDLEAYLESLPTYRGEA